MLVIFGGLLFLKLQAEKINHSVLLPIIFLKY